MCCSGALIAASCAACAIPVAVFQYAHCDVSYEDRDDEHAAIYQPHQSQSAIVYGDPTPVHPIASNCAQYEHIQA